MTEILANVHQPKATVKEGNETLLGSGGWGGKDHLMHLAQV
jgi:hypothetical protein